MSVLLDLQQRVAQLERTLCPGPRVGFITPGLGPGGAERWILSLVRNLTCRVSGIFSLWRGGQLEPEALSLTRVTDSVEELADMSDVLIGWGLRDARSLLANVRPGMKYIWVSHGTNSLEFSRLVGASLADVPGSHYAAVCKAAAEVFPPKIEGVRIIENGIELDRVIPTRPFLRDKTILFLGRVAEEKRPEIVVRTLKHLPDWQARFLGDSVTTPHGEYVKALARSEGVADRCVFLPVVRCVGDELAKAGVMMLPSATEAMPLALLEAWAAGTPTVCCDWPWVQEQQMRVHGAGEVLPVNSEPVEFAAAVIRAYRSLSLGSADGRRDRVFTNYTSVAMAYRWGEFIKEICV